MRRTLYLGCPKKSYAGDPASLLEQVRAEPTWDCSSWELHVTYYASDKSVDARDFSSRVMKHSGPVLLLEQIQKNSRREIYRRVASRVPYLVDNVIDLNQLVQAISHAIMAYENGEPPIPLDQAVALMLMQKLDHNQMWAGNAKGYMWTDDLRKGRGVDEQYAPRLPFILSILLKGDMLVFKVSKGKRKYALNPMRRPEIYEIIRTQHFPGDVGQALCANIESVSVRALDRCVVPERPDRRF